MASSCFCDFKYFWAIFVLCGVSGNDKLKVGPYDILFDKAGECSDFGSGDIRVDMKVKRLTRTTVAIDANMTLKYPLDDDTKVVLKLAQFTNGGYKSNFYTLDVPKACNTVHKLVPVVQNEIFKAAKMGSKCPVKPGTYHLHNFTSKEQINTMPVFFYGRYKAEIIYYRFAKRIGCMELYATIVPKRANSNSIYKKRN